MPDQTVNFDDERPVDDLPDDEARTAVERTPRPQRTAAAALSMALAGASNVEIAELLHYDSPGQARAAWEDQLAKAYDHEKDTAAFRSMQSARLNRALKSVSAIAFKETVEVPNPDKPGEMMRIVNPRQLEGLREFRNVVESLSKLHGVEAARVVAMVTPESKEFAMVVGQVADAIKSGTAIEGDIFDAEIIDVEEVGDDE